jgi:hypothetical protein
LPGQAQRGWKPQKVYRGEPVEHSSPEKVLPMSSSRGDKGHHDGALY